jgi:hypothetical protein
MIGSAWRAWRLQRARSPTPTPLAILPAWQLAWQE